MGPQLWVPLHDVGGGEEGFPGQSGQSQEPGRRARGAPALTFTATGLTLGHTKRVSVVERHAKRIEKVPVL